MLNVSHCPEPLLSAYTVTCPVSFSCYNWNLPRNSEAFANLKQLLGVYNRTRRNVDFVATRTTKLNRTWQHEMTSPAAKKWGNIEVTLVPFQKGGNTIPQQCEV